ncbi:ATPase, V0 complex [Phytophthora cactorum]|nr:ATPase, V0 complex [Phytophthora cactorum]
MKWLRSAEMEYISLIVNEDAAHDCVQKLGDLGVLEFTDLNPELTPFQRRYVNYVKRCDEMERKLRYFEVELAKFSISPKPAGSIDHFLAGSADIRYGSQDTAARALDTLERLLEDKEQELLQLNSMHEKLTREYNERKELQEIISRAGEFFEIEIPEVQARRTSRTASRSGYSFVETSPGVTAGEESSSLRFRNRLKFERMIFRTTRGNCFTRFSPIEEPLVDPTNGQPVTKHAFVIFFQSTFIEGKLRKICDAFHARLYSLPPMDDRAAIAHLIQSNAGELNQSSHILRRNRESCVLLCRDLAETLESWKWSVLQEKATYHALNIGMLRAEDGSLKALSSVRRAVTRAIQRRMTTVACAAYVLETNKFTDAFQAFVETEPVGVHCRDVPFLFGVMYGDIGHGLCVLLFGLYLILTERKLEQPGGMGEMTASIYGGRYMLFMMGAFAIYAGLIYNDFFSLPLNLFGSKFAYPDCLESHDREAKCVAQYLIDGKMTYVNATDVSAGDNMKISVILRIVQMTFGILLKGWNNLYFRDYSTFFFEFVPQIVFAVSLFCYMIVLIVMKWTDEARGVSYNYAGEHTGCRPPSLVNTLINIALAPGNVVDPLYEGQLETQQTLLMMAFVSPIYLKIQNDRTAPPVSHHVDFDDEAEERLVSHHHGNSSGGHGGHGESSSSAK